MYLMKNGLINCFCGSMGLSENQERKNNVWMGFRMFQWFSVSSGNLMPCCSYCYWITVLAAQFYTNLAFLDKPHLVLNYNFYMLLDLFWLGLLSRFSRGRLCATPKTAPQQAPLSNIQGGNPLGFRRPPSYLHVC